MFDGIRSVWNFLPEEFATITRSCLDHTGHPDLSLYADEVSASLSKEERKRLLDEFAFMPEQPDMKASMANAKNVVGRPVARQALKKIMQEAKEQRAIEAENHS